MTTYAEIYKTLMLLESSSTEDLNDPNTWPEEKQIDYVQKKHDNIKNIKNPSERVQLAAVQRNGVAIYYIKKPSEKIQLAAVQQNPYAIKYIENPSEIVQLAAIQQKGHGNHRVKQLPIRFLKSSYDKAQSQTVEIYHVIQLIKNPTEKVKLAAVQQDSLAIQFIEDPSEAVQLAAVQGNGYVIQFIKNPSEKVQRAAVKQNFRAIRYINNPSEDVQLEAMQQSHHAISYIKNPSYFIKTLSQVMKNEHISRHQLILFVEQALEKSKQYPFLLEILKEKGWA
jgi:hypothetical protein